MPAPSSHTTGRAVRHPAVHAGHASLRCTSMRLIKPIFRSVALGTARFMCQAPAFHQGPRPLETATLAWSGCTPRRTSSLYRVRGCFHWRHSNPRNFLRTHVSNTLRLFVTWAIRKYATQPWRTTLSSSQTRTRFRPRPRRNRTRSLALSRLIDSEATFSFGSWCEVTL